MAQPCWCVLVAVLTPGPVGPHQYAIKRPLHPIRALQQEGACQSVKELPVEHEGGKPVAPLQCKPCQGPALLQAVS